MKEKLLNNLGIKIISVLAAIIIWILVVNIDDYSVTKTITGIQVEIQNDGAIAESGKVYEVTDGKTVDIIVKGRRSVVESLTAKDFLATADLSKLSITNAATIDIRAKSKQVQSAITITPLENMLTVELENLVSKQFAITVATTGEPKEGYTVGPSVAAPNIVTVSGAQSVVDKISTAQVSVDVNEASEDVTMDVEPVFLDETGMVIEGQNLSLSKSSVNVCVQILKTKAVAVELTTIGLPAEGYEFVGITFQPTTITIAGEEEDLRNINKIYIRDIKLDGLNGNKELTIETADYLANGIIATSDSAQIMVQINVSKVIENQFTIRPTDVSIVNEDSKYRYSIAFPDGVASSITAKGTAEHLSKCTIKKLNPTVDVTGYGLGTHYVTVHFEDCEGVEIAPEIRVAVTVVENSTAN